MGQDYLFRVCAHMSGHAYLLHAVADPGFPVGGGGVDLQHRRFSVKMYAKMKELGPIGEGVRLACPPPRSANDMSSLIH